MPAFNAHPRATRILTVILISFSWCVQAEHLFLRASATGTDNGANWNNAWSSVAKIQWGSGSGKVGVGDTLWIAAGHYGQINLAAVGTNAGQIYIRRADGSQSSCTSAPGWQTSLDDRVLIELIGDTTATTSFQIQFGNIWYVDRGVAAGGNGVSWVTAWSDTTAIKWGFIQPGDVINLSGGISGKTYSTFTVPKGGVAGHPLTIRRSSEAGHDGVVTINSSVVSIQRPYTILDGGLPDKFIINVVAATNYAARGSVNVYPAADYFELRNASVVGDFTGKFGHSVGIAAPHAVISRCKFIKSVYEDMLSFTGAGGSLTIEHSLFLNNTNNDEVHRDVMNPYVSGAYDLTIRGNMFVNAGDVFLIQNPVPLGNVRIAYNLFYNTGRGVAFGTGNQGAASVTAYNNTFYNVTASVQGYTGTVPLNNLTKLVGTANVRRDDDSIIPNLLWLNVASPLGGDGLPFTMDDGFNLAPGSAAINVGATTPEQQDILANPLIGLPDLGAYEFQGN
jgi:hypothetical protein